MAFSDSAINGSLKLALLDLPDALLLFLNNFLDFGSLLSLEKVSKELRTLCRNPHSCYQLTEAIHRKLISYLDILISYTVDDYWKNTFRNTIARFVYVKHLTFAPWRFTHYSSDSNHYLIFDYFYNNLYRPIALHSQSSSMHTLDWRQWNVTERDVTIHKPPLSFSCQTVYLPSGESGILPQLYDVQHLYLKPCVRTYFALTSEDCLSYLFLNKHRFNLQTLHISNYESPSTASMRRWTKLPTAKGIHLHSNGLFFNEFKDINVNNYHQTSKQNLHTIHCSSRKNTIWIDTLFFFYNICKLSFQTIRSLHISDDILRIPEYKDIYQNIRLNQLEELCLTINCNIYVYDEEDIRAQSFNVSDLVLHSEYKYFQTPNVTRLNFHFSFDESRMVKLKRKTYDFNRFCNAFGIETNRLRSFSLNISSMQDTRNHDDNDMDEETALFYSFWNVNVVCMQCMEFVESIMEGDRSTDDGFSFGVYLSEGIYYDHTIESGSDDNGVYIETGSFVPNHCQRIVEMTRSIDALWCKYPQKFNVVKLRFCCDEKTSRMATKVFDPTKYPNWIFATKTILGCGDHAFQRSSCGALEWKRVNQKYCKSPGFISECAACILPIMDNYR